MTYPSRVLDLIYKWFWSFSTCFHRQCWGKYVVSTT